MRTTILVYANYPDSKEPYMESECIRSMSDIADEVFIIGNIKLPNMINKNVTILNDDILLDQINKEFPDVIHRYGLDLRVNHPNIIADYLAYNGLYVLNELYGFKDIDKVLKLDTDYYVTSPFVLNSIFQSKSNIVHRDLNLRVHYGKGETYLNAACVFQTKSDYNHHLYNSSIFGKAIESSIFDHRYAATGPALVNENSYYSLFVNESLTPWTFDVSKVHQPYSKFSKGVTMEGDVRYESVQPSRSLGLHLIASELKYVYKGLKIKNISHTPNGLAIDIGL